jgi:hypothetical protein
MSFNPAKVKALRDASVRRGQLASPGNVSSVGIGVSGGEEVGGSVGGLDFLTPGGGAASMVDSVEEMFSEFDEEGQMPFEKEGAVKLVFPLVSGEIGLDEDWTWNVCGGLIGGPRGNRFCTKNIADTRECHCGVASHAAHKADLKEGHGYIPSAHDRSNTESAFLSPTLSGWRFPNSVNDLANQAMSHEQWVAFLTYLPPGKVMHDSSDIEVEIAAEALEKSKLGVSFAVTPARQKPKLPYLISEIMKPKSAKNLETRFDEEDEAMDKMDLPFSELEAPITSEDIKMEANGPDAFSPSVAQWNSLIHKVETLTSELASAREAVSVMAEVSETRFEVVDRQVINLRGSIGTRPNEGGSALPSLDLWSNVADLSAEVGDHREALKRPKPSPYESLTRSLVDSTQKVAKKQALTLSSLESSKAEYVGQIKPLESIVEDITEDLYGPQGSYNQALMSRLGTPAGPTDSPLLRNQLNSLTEQVRELTGAGLGGGVVDINDPTITSLKADLARLYSDNLTIKASLGGEVVRIEDESFHSADEVKRWIVDCAGAEPGAFEFFFDATSMLEALQDSGRTSDETLDSQAASRKANHRSVNAARMLNSFGVTVPQIMNKKNSSEPFSLVPDHAKWKSNDGRSGLVETIRKALKLWSTQTAGRLTSRFSSSSKREVLALARALMSKSMAFWTSLCNWIDEFYGKLLSKTMAQTPGPEASLAERKEYDSIVASVQKEAWQLVLNVMTDIFQELALKRADGQAASDMNDDPALQSAIVLYSSLKAHKFMDELVERSFERHPVMAPTFNGFLFSERASHGDIKRLELKLTEMGNLTRTLQSKVDKK